MEIGAIYKESVQRLITLYGEEEAVSMVSILFEDLLKISRVQRMRNANQTLERRYVEILEAAIGRLLKHIPIQHITAFAYFLGRTFSVNEHVLIPRPETEELVSLIKNENRLPKPTILDIGTGSGCIAISLALEIPGSTVSAVDLSEEALIMAEQNAKDLGARVAFRKMDILTEKWAEPLDILVSNPPYIPIQERAKMSKNVVNYEPGMALFVPDNDPMIFYLRIGEIGMKCLKADGRLYVEIHENLGRETADVFINQGYRAVKIHKDLYGKERIVSAIKEI